ncbi:MAG: MlaD family protein [Ignavibacterium sp.]|nr:MlaD family protein [Ignavibacterium sp.]MCX7612035.1 MlaD family protein [Ignavibacterium sp.]MDW8374818.1 MlaD family protein [Ignavibacteriales bacterium]
MLKDLSGAKLGIFIFVGSVLLIVGIFMLGNKDQLFVSTFNIKAYFKNTEGLRNGAAVRFGGIDVGAVSNIKIMPDTSGLVEVTMRIKSEIRRFIKKDSRATIETEGLVGNKVVTISMGSSDAELVENNGTILSREPLSFADVIEETQGILSYTKEMTRNLSEIISRVNQGEGTIGKIINDEELYKAATNITKTADKSLTSLTEDLRNIISLFDELGRGVETVVKNTNNVVASIDTLLQGVSEGKGILGTLMTDQGTEGKSINRILENLVQVSEDTKISASRLAENMEALKHNWLFKSYYENRGYWDKAEFEKQIDSKLNELNEKIILLDKKISELKSLENQNK